MNNDRIFELYEGSLGEGDSQLRARRRVHWLCARAQGELVVDVGCSQGVATILVAREGHRVIGVDNEQAAIDFAADRLAAEEAATAARVELRLGDGRALELDDGVADTVLLGEVLEHQVDPGGLIAEAHRVLKPGGRLVLTTPYGVFPYPDHKEPLYLRDVIALVRDRFAVEEIEVIDRWMGLVLTAATRRRAIPAAVWDAALAAAEQRTAALDAELQDRRSTIRSLRERLSEAHDRLSVVERELAAAQARAPVIDELAAEHEALRATLQGAEAERRAERAQTWAVLERLTATLERAVAAGRAPEEDAEEPAGAEG